MTRKGQVTVPAAIRAALGLEEGDQLEFELDEESKRVTVKTAASVVEATYGIFRHAARPGLIPEERRLAREAWAKRASKRNAPPPD